jgi:hypothetical protein
LIAKAADQVAQRMATEGVTAEEDHIDREGECADADPKSIGKTRRFQNVVAEDENKDEREIEKITVNILHDEREGTFAEISLARLAHGAGRWVSPEGLVVGSAIIVTGKPKAAGRPKNQERW